MRKSDYEMLSNDELQMILADQSSYSSEEIACVKKILQERNIIGHIAGNTTDAVFEQNVAQIPMKREAATITKDIRNDIRIIRNCAIFFVIITTISLLVSLIFGINLISTFSKVAELASGK